MLSNFSLVTCLVALCGLSVSAVDKYRICVVDGKGNFKKSAKYCPILDNADSKVECILAPDRLDCLRRLSKGTADFSIFTPEDLVTATNSGIEILLTNELRYTNDKNEYEVVAVVSHKSGIKNRHDLKDQHLCHPGYGDETDMTRILANYLEASVVPPLCNPKLTITENRIKATANFFSASCKPGAWVDNPSDDQILKSKYPTLCANCDNPRLCSMHDKYWGRRGSLFCLTDGAGDVAWGRLDDVKSHFGITPGGQEANANDYSYLCPDGDLHPINSTKPPCIWVVKPWPAVAAIRPKAQEIQELVSSLSYNDPKEWKANLFNLIESSHARIERLEPMEAIEAYLDRATGFLSANSFSGCHPPRTIRICTTSIIENAKCSWLGETAAVYGIEPELNCIKADNTTHCMIALSENAAHVVMVPPNALNLAQSFYKLKPLFYETVNDDSKYITVAVTKTGSKITNYADLRGKKACFPMYDGIAWNTVMHTLFHQKLIEECPIIQAMSDFFGPSCVPELPDSAPRNLGAICESSGTNYGELGALHCLTSGLGDIAFVSKNSIRKFVENERENIRNRYKTSDFQVLCLGEDKQACHMSWGPAGYGMVLANQTELWQKDTLDVFLQMDRLFGTNYQSLTTPFTMYGKYNGESDVLFHDDTIRLRNVPTARNTESMYLNYEGVIKYDRICVGSSSNVKFSLGFMSVLIMLVFVR